MATDAPPPRPRGCLGFLGDPGGATRLAGAHARPALFVLGLGLVHFPVALHPRLGDYRWVVVGVGAVSLLVGSALLHVMLLGAERIVAGRARAEARRARRAEAPAGAPEAGPPSESGDEFESGSDQDLLPGADGDR